MLTRFVGSLVLASALVSTAAGAASPVVNGANWITIEDGTTNQGCVDVSKNLVSMILVGAQLQRDQSWWNKIFHQTAALGVKFDVVITNGNAQAFDFPRVQQVHATSQTSQIGLLPMRYPIMSKYALIGADNQPYGNLQLNLYFIEVDKKSSAMNTLDSLTDFSKSLPLPPNPYQVGMEYFGNFANKLEQQNISNGPSQDPDATLSLDLARDADDAAPNYCSDPSRQMLRAGIQAAVWDYAGNVRDGNFIHVAEAGNYCFWFSASDDRIKYARKPSDGQCPKSFPSSANELDNPLITVAISSWPILPSPGSPSPHLTDVVQSMPNARTFSAQEVTTFARKSFGSGSLDAGVVHPTVIEGVLTNMSKRNPNRAALMKLQSQASPQDVATVLALRRCAIVGVSAADCN